jgi:hypothetical protein
MERIADLMNKRKEGNKKKETGPWAKDERSRKSNGR